MSALLRIAAGGPASVFPVIGPGRRARVEDLALAPGIELAASPRHAALLLVCGELPEDCGEALARVHDQLPHPRATVWWQSPPCGPARIPVVVQGEDPVPAIREIHRALLGGGRRSEAPWLGNTPPHAWRGRGEHGQGGEGMMGGVPYGRPMAMTDEDARDGLALDALTFRIGPFAPMLPPGLVLALTLQGDVVQEAKLLREPFAEPCRAGVGTPLRRLARFALLQELHALARALFTAASRADRGEAVDGAAMARAVYRAGLPFAVASGLGLLDDGTDVRARVADWADDVAWGEGEAEEASTALPPGALTGLEWDRMLAVIHSVPASALRRPAEGDG